MTEYFLAPGVHVCVSTDHLVILDESRGKYLGMPVESVRALVGRIRGWPVNASQSTNARDDAEALLRHFHDLGLITPDPLLGKSAAPVSVDLQNAWHNDRWLRHPPAIQCMHVLHFLLAVGYAAVALRWMPLARIIRRVRHRKQRNTDRSIDTERLGQLMTVYERLRPLLYTRKDACMLHSLAVLEFLARYDIFPDWVLGVRTSPFRAHSWLQCDGLALTDSPLRLQRLTPILKI